MTMIKPKTCVATMITPQCEGQSGSTFPLSNLCEIMIVVFVIGYVVIAWSASEIALNGWVSDHDMLDVWFRTASYNRLGVFGSLPLV